MIRSCRSEKTVFEELTHFPRALLNVFALGLIACALAMGCSLSIVPTANFSADVTSGPTPLSVLFTDESNPGSSPIGTWLWDFGDGVTSADKDATHAYSTAGTFSVSLTVTTEEGTDTSVRTDFISAEAAVPEPPTLDPLTSPTVDTSVMITGTTVADATVEISGGVSCVLTTADENGAFSAVTTIAPNQKTRLFVTSSMNGLKSAPTPVEVTHDTQAPFLFIDFPPDGSELTTDTISVAGRISDMLSGFMGLDVTVNGAPAQVIVGIGTNGTFERANTPLTLGQNIISATAMDTLGNMVTREITVTRVDVTGPRMTVFSGAGQSGPVKSELAEPLVVLVTQENGTPIVGQTVTFDVIRSDGRLASEMDVSPGQLMLDAVTDASGLAQVFWTLGTDAGCGNNRISVTGSGIGGATFFCASADPGPAVQINVGSGNNQRAETGSVAPQALRVWVNDSGNGVAGVPVIFDVILGDGLVGGAVSTTVITGITGHAETPLTLGAEGGLNLIQATFEDNPGQAVSFMTMGIARGEASATSFSGFVFDNSGQPIGGAVCDLVVNGEAAGDTLTDDEGFFLFGNLPSGPAHISIDGMTATLLGGITVPEGSFPALAFDTTLVEHAENTLPAPVMLPRLNPNNAVTYDGTKDVVLTVDGIDGLKLTVRAGSMRRADGSVPTPTDPAILSLNQVHFDEIPMPLPDGAAPPFAWTLQPAGATFDPPVEAVYPNMSGLPPGSISYFLTFNHATGQFEIFATGSVSDDGSEIVTDPGSGLLLAGWGGICPPYTATGGGAPCEANLVALLEQAARFTLGLVKDMNKVTRAIACGISVFDAGSKCVTAYTGFRQSSPTAEQQIQAIADVTNCTKGIKTAVVDCLAVAAPIDPTKSISRAKKLSDALGRAIKSSRANKCFVGPTGDKVLKGLEGLNNAVNNLLGFAGELDIKKIAVNLTCFAMNAIIDSLELATKDGLMKGIDEEFLLELDTMMEELSLSLDDMIANDEVLGNLVGDEETLRMLEEAGEDFQSALDDETPITELAGFTLMLGGQIAVADSHGGFVFENIGVPDLFGLGGPGTPRDLLGDDLIRVLGFKADPGGTRYVYSTAFRIKQGVSTVVAPEDLMFSNTPPPFADSIRLRSDQSVVSEGGTAALTVLGTFFDGTDFDATLAESGTAYRSSNAEIAIVSPDGVVTGQSQGAVFITATNNGATSVRGLFVLDDIIVTTVQGFVRDGDGNPVEGAIITASFGGSVMTDATGFFSFSINLPSGTTQITVFVETEDESFSSGPVTVVPGGTTDVGTITPFGEGMVTTVEGSAEFVDGSPVEGATVTTNFGRETLTDATGAFSLTIGVPEGEQIQVIVSLEFGEMLFQGTAGPFDPVVDGVTDVGTVVLREVQGAIYPQMRLRGGDNPVSLVIGDLDNDGNDDVVSLNGATHISMDISIYMGRGGGEFRPPLRHLLNVVPDDGPQSMALDDFDNNGILDIVLLNLDGTEQNIVLLLGNGDGTFQNERLLPGGVTPIALGSGDLNNDENVDLVVANRFPDGVTILLGNGDGTFGDPSSMLTGDAPSALVLAELNGDLNLDMAVAHSSDTEVAVFPGNGDGTFGKPFRVASVVSVEDMVAGNVDDDAFVDLVTTESFAVAVLLGNGDGTFMDPIKTTGVSALSVALGDVNDDTFADVIVPASGTGVAILFGNGDGTLQAPVFLPAGQTPFDAALSDLDDDGDLDILAVNRDSDDISIMLGDGDGTFPPHSLLVGDNPTHVAVGLVNDDAFLDIVSADFLGSNVSLLLGNGDGTFQPAVSRESATRPKSILLVDLNNDTKLDVVTASTLPNVDGLVVLLGNGDGTFEPGILTRPDPRPDDMVAAFLNDDENIDIISANESGNLVSVMLGNGDGTFEPAVTVSTGFTNPQGLSVGDLNGDTVLDFVVANNFSGNTVSVALGVGDGTFLDPMTLAPQAGEPAQIALADVNKDTRLDIITANETGGTMTVYLGVGDGSFGPPIEIDIVGNGSESLFVVDVNMDTNLDVILADPDADRILVLFGDGDGAFPDFTGFGTGDRPVYVISADLNADGLPDIITADGQGDTVTVSLHR